MFGCLFIAVGTLIFEGYPRLWPLNTPALLAVLYMGVLDVGQAHFLWWAIVGRRPALPAVSKDEARQWAHGCTFFDAQTVRIARAPRAPNFRTVSPSTKRALNFGYTAMRRPVELVYSEFFERIVDAITAERQVKGWFRAKKEVLVAGDSQRIAQLSQRRTPSGPHGSMSLRDAPHHEVLASKKALRIDVHFELHAAFRLGRGG